MEKPTTESIKTTPEQELDAAKQSLKEAVERAKTKVNDAIDRYVSDNFLRSVNMVEDAVDLNEVGYAIDRVERLQKDIDQKQQRKENEKSAMKFE